MVSLSRRFPSRQALRVSLFALLLTCTGLVACSLHAPSIAHAAVPIGTPYVHIATPANSAADFTQMYNASFNGDPNAVLLVTPNWTPNEVYDNHPIGVFYGAPYWYIFNEDFTPIPNGAAFNVIEEPYSPCLCGITMVQVATSANSSSNSTIINEVSLNNNPYNRLFVTPNWNPGERAWGVYNDHPIGVSYNAFLGRWSIFNQDGAPMPNGASFNVFWFGLGEPQPHVATSANSFGDYTVVNDEPGTDNPNALVFVTPDFISPGVYENHNLGVFYNPGFGRWSIFNQDGTPMPNGAAFNVFACSDGQCYDA